MKPDQAKLEIPFIRAVRRSSEDVTLDIDGQIFLAGAEDTVATAILLAGALPNRLSAVTGQPRAPFCMMGACFECLAEVDGVPLRQTCVTPVRDGMRVRTAKGKLV